jgi:hypothetical protein
MKTHLQRCEAVFNQFTIDSEDAWSLFLGRLFAEGILTSDETAELRPFYPDSAHEESDKPSKMTWESFCAALIQLSSTPALESLSNSVGTMVVKSKELEALANRYLLDEAASEDATAFADQLDVLLASIEKLDARLGHVTLKVQETSSFEWDMRHIYNRMDHHLHDASRWMWSQPYAFQQDRYAVVRKANLDLRLPKPIVDGKYKKGSHGYLIGKEARTALPLELLPMPQNKLGGTAWITCQVLAAQQLVLSSYFPRYLGTAKDNREQKEFAMFSYDPDALPLARVLTETGKFQEGPQFRFLARECLKAFVDLDCQCPLQWEYAIMRTPMEYLFLSPDLRLVVRHWPFTDFVIEPDASLDVEQVPVGCAQHGSAWLTRSLALMDCFFTVVKSLLFDPPELWSADLRSLYEKHEDQKSRSAVNSRFRFLLPKDLLMHEAFRSLADYDEEGVVHLTFEQAFPMHT